MQGQKPASLGVLGERQRVTGLFMSAPLSVPPQGCEGSTGCEATPLSCKKWPPDGVIRDSACVDRGGLTAWNATHTSTPTTPHQWNPCWDVKVEVVAPAIHSGLWLAPTAEVQIILEEVVLEEKDQSSPGPGRRRRQKKSESSLFTLDCSFHISHDNKHEQDHRSPLSCAVSRDRLVSSCSD